MEPLPAHLARSVTEGRLIHPSECAAAPGVISVLLTSFPPLRGGRGKGSHMFLDEGQRVNAGRTFVPISWVLWCGFGYGSRTRAGSGPGVQRSMSSCLR